uniref:Putative secreted protein n=1 Tax=Anopheles darlingi TaxID=43151 RepID=A0A2M4DNL7_ANODA
MITKTTTTIIETTLHFPLCLSALCWTAVRSLESICVIGSTSRLRSCAKIRRPLALRALSIYFWFSPNSPEGAQVLGTPSWIRFSHY